MLLPSKSRRLLLVAVASMLLLLPLVAAKSHEEELQQDKPIVNFNALFLAYIRLGDALFGSWSPEGIERKLLTIREFED